MKKTVTAIFFFILLISVCSFAQTYQLPNGGFENWDGTGVNDEPSFWNGFPSAACDLTGFAALGCSAATTTRHQKSSDTRPNSSGSYSCKLFANSVLGIIANGTLTTGQIRIGSTTAASAENYNITRTSNSSFKQNINAKPDSIVFWAKFLCPSETQCARMNAIIHDNYNYLDPDISDPSASQHIVGRSVINFTRANQNWKRYSVPFNYIYTASTPYFILITFTTNMVQGVGSTSDQLYIDDIELIYNTNLTEILVDGTLINGFNPNIYNYTINYECGSTPTFSAQASNPNANVNITQPNGSNPGVIEVINGDKNRLYTININYVNQTYFYDEICQGNIYRNNGFELETQNIAGIFEHANIVYSSEFCDSMNVLRLTVNPTFQNDTNYIMICETGEYNFYGNLLTEPGIYDTTLISQHGCDSTITLELSVGDYYRSYINASICKGETYSENGFNLSTSGTDSLFYTAANGCDSLVILNLSTNPTFITELFDTIPQGTTYAENNFEIFATNIPGEFVFTSTLETIFGCDSILNLHLNIIAELDDSTQQSSTDFGFTLYPNPASEEITIKAENHIDITLDFIIYDTFGKIIFSGIINKDETHINIKNLAYGIYFVKIFANIESGNSMKFIKY
ncbi:MAG: T9SS type A sorting domain-containing protein [Bacteroidales bacterium]|nr:T9SS type A sorting domain-containing protein [Bacteroidales bacterium]